MKNLSERKVNDHIRRAASAMTPNNAELLWTQPVEAADSDAWFLDGTQQNNTKPILRFVRWASLAAACLAIVFISWLRVYRAPDATVYLDVNPSISVDVNRMGRVVAVTPDNEGGRIILDNMNLRNTDIDVAVNALLGSMVRHGYLSQTQNTLLLSVNGKDAGRTEALRRRVSTDAEQTLNALLGQSIIILEQTVDPDDAIEEIAEQYGITPGKAALILRLLQDQPSWNIKELAGMPMSDLLRYCRTAGIDIFRYLGDNGEVIGDLDSLFDKEDDDDDPDDEDDEREDADDPDDSDDDGQEDDRDDDGDQDDRNDADEDSDDRDEKD